MNEHTIVTEKRPDDYIAYVDEESQIWGCGITRELAVYSLMASHQEYFNIDILCRG